MEQDKDDQKPEPVSRRKFIGALGAAAIAGGILQSTRKAKADAAQTYYFVDSYGQAIPMAEDTVAAGIFPPLATPPSQNQGPLAQRPRPRGGRFRPEIAPGGGGCQGTTSPHVSDGFPKWNILMVMVDQMRWPVWLPHGTSDWETLFSQYLPNIYALQQYAYVFNNYSTAATRCTPARATLLTGLYPQQTGQFVTATSPPSPPLKPYSPPGSNGQYGGFPTIGNVLSQSWINNGNWVGGYDTAWIGKWHLSASPFQTSGPGINGPSDYGFTNPDNIPTSSSLSYGHSYFSPDGFDNEGNAGDFLDLGSPVYPSGPTYPYSGYGGLTPPAYSGGGRYYQLSDSAIAAAFLGQWMTNLSSHLGGGLPSGQAWFAAVSFVNPHDINWFPYAYDYAETSPTACPSGQSLGDFDCATAGYINHSGYQPAPVSSTPQTYHDSVANSPYTTTIAGLPQPYTTQPDNWNYADDPALYPYTAAQLANGPVKPGIQASFQTSLNVSLGAVDTTSADYPDGWLTFLNYYFWMQKCVDVQIGQILYSTPAPNPTFQSYLGDAVIIFLSDHGDFGGSHNLHSKGGALYDEVTHVPLYISFPGQRMTQMRMERNFACSSVDILPFLYSLAIGNEGWRCAQSDIVKYLNGRESLWEIIFGGDTVTPRRVVPGIQVMNPGQGLSGSTNVQYVLHTTDEDIPAASPAPPGHAIAFRTVDITTTPNKGAKLGIYSYWDSCSTCPSTATGSNQQFEFYNYYGGNVGEVGNEGVASIDANGVTHLTTTGLPYSAAQYLTAFNSLIYEELYVIYQPLVTAWQQAMMAYFQYEGQSCSGQLGVCTSG